MVTVRKGLGDCFRVIVLFSICGLAGAQSLYKWIDENGNVTYQDSPPPSNVEFEEQTYIDPDEPLLEEIDGSDTDDVEDQLTVAVETSPVSLYSIPACDACDLVRLFLENNGVPYEEKDIRDNLTLQKELQEIIGGLQVPTVLIGDKVIDGYSKSALREALIEKNYPVEQLAASGSPEESSNTIDGEAVDDELAELTNVFDQVAEQIELFEDEDEEETGFYEEPVLEIENVE